MSVWKSKFQSANFFLSLDLRRYINFLFISACNFSSYFFRLVLQILQRFLNHLPWTFIFFMCLENRLQDLLIHLAWVFGDWLLEVLEFVFELLEGYRGVIINRLIFICIEYCCCLNLFGLSFAFWIWFLDLIRIPLFITLGMLRVSISESQNITASLDGMIKVGNSFRYLIRPLVDWHT